MINRAALLAEIYSIRLVGEGEIRVPHLYCGNTGAQWPEAEIDLHRFIQGQSGYGLDADIGEVISSTTVSVEPPSLMMVIMRLISWPVKEASD